MPGALPTAAKTTRAATKSVAFINAPPNSTCLTIDNHIEVMMTFKQAVPVIGIRYVRPTCFTSVHQRIVKPNRSDLTIQLRPARSY